MRQVHLVEYRYDLDSQFQRSVAVGNGLRFHALTGIHNKQRTFTCGEGTRDFIREVNVAWCVDQIEVVNLSVECFVFERSSLRLDGYPTFFFDVHRIKNLSRHFTVLQAATTLNQAIGER